MKNSASSFAVDPPDVRGASIGFPDGSSFCLIRQGDYEYTAAGHPQGIFPNAATSFQRRITGDDGVPAEDWRTFQRMTEALDRAPRGRCVNLEL